MHAPVTACRPVVAQYEPPGHTVGAVMDADAHSAPAGHVTSAVEPAGQYLPAVHAPVGETRPAVAQYEPAVHCAAAMVPTVHSEPSGQFVPDWGYAVALVVPGGHQCVLPVHVPVTVTCPAVAQYEPAGHSVGADKPVAVQSAPTGHCTCAAADAGQ